MDKVRSLSLSDLGVNLTAPRPATVTENDTIIAALRLWQSVQAGYVILLTEDGGPCGLDHFEDIATNAGQHPAQTSEEIDVLLDDVLGIV